MDGPDLVTITLYTKEVCGLCDELKLELAELSAEFPHQLVEVDIEADPVLFAKYRFEIPVLDIGEVILKAPISRQDLIVAFAQIQHQNPPTP